eukprot:10106741-Alexandrium_andersonii.AAC.1
MSASLVGSEMCIRDSVRTVPGRHAGQSGFWGSTPSGLGVSACTGGGPVSYTHLTLPTICSV